MQECCTCIRHIDRTSFCARHRASPTGKIYRIYPYPSRRTGASERHAMQNGGSDAQPGYDCPKTPPANSKADTRNSTRLAVILAVRVLYGHQEVFCVGRTVACPKLVGMWQHFGQIAMALSAKPCAIAVRPRSPRHVAWEGRFPAAALLHSFSHFCFPAGALLAATRFMRALCCLATLAPAEVHQIEPNTRQRISHLPWQAYNCSCSKCDSERHFGL